MNATVEQTQTDLARLIRLANRGEDIVITEAGQPIARLTAIPQHVTTADHAQWLESLRQLRDLTSADKAGRTSDEILAEDRGERD